MALRRCIRSFSTLTKQIQHNKSLSIKIENVLFQHEPTRLCEKSLASSIQVRHLLKDASKTNVPDDGRIRIYYGVLTPQIRAVKWFSLTTSMMGLIAQPFIYKELVAMHNLPIVIAGCTFVGFFTFITPLLLHYITKKYVTHLDYKPDSDTYIATTVNFMCMLKETTFKVDDVKVPEVPGMFTTLFAKGKPLFFDPRMFYDATHYGKLMGYDKPIDYKMYEDDKNK